MSNQQGAAEKPNIIWIFGDQHRGQALSCEGDPNVNTPNIDLLAQLGEGFVSVGIPNQVSQNGGGDANLQKRNEEFPQRSDPCLR